MADAESSERGIILVIVLRQWRVPEGHDRIADEFIDRAALRDDRVAPPIEQCIDERHEVFRWQLLAERREAADIDEQHGYVLDLAAKLEGIGMAFDLMQDIGRYEVAESVSEHAPVAVGHEQAEGYGR